MSERNIELFPAFLWTCEDCGRDNFARVILMAAQEINLDDLVLRNGQIELVREWLDAGGDGEFVTAPDRVTCAHCGAKFDADPA